MDVWLRIFLYGITFSPVIFYGIGFEKTLTVSRDMKKFFLQIPQLLLKIVFSILILWQLCIFGLSYSKLSRLFPLFLVLIVALVNRLLSLFFVETSLDFTNDVFSFGAVFISIHVAITLLDALVIGFLICCTLFLMTILLDFAKRRMVYSNIPICMRGTPLFLVFMGVFSLIFLGTGISWWIAGR